MSAFVALRREVDIPIPILPSLVVAQGTALEIAQFLMRRLPQLNWMLRSSTARDASVAMRGQPIDLHDGLEVRRCVNGLLAVSCLIYLSMALSGSLL